jgi:hypothetical protein
VVTREVVANNEKVTLFGFDHDMNDQNLLKGLLLAAVALAFGLGAFRYPIGEFSRAGPGLFPLVISGILMVIAIVSIVRSRFVERVPLDFSIRNIVIIMVALCGLPWCPSTSTWCWASRSWSSSRPSRATATRGSATSRSASP